MPTLEITTRIGCANACVYCPQDKLIREYSKISNEFVMSLDVFKACMDKVPEEIEIEFSGMSEPWLNPACTDMALYAHTRGHRINVFTTLAGMNIVDWMRLKAIPFNRFWLHLPSNGNEEQIPSGNEYIDLVKTVHDFLKDHQEIDVSFHIRGQAPRADVAKLLGEEIKKKRLSTRASNVKVNNVSDPIRKKGTIGCARGLRNGVLLPNGDVLLCCMDYEMKHVLGNLLESSYESLYQSEEFKKVERGLKDESIDILCRYCDMFACNVSGYAKVRNNIGEGRRPKEVVGLLKKMFLKKK